MTQHTDDVLTPTSDGLARARSVLLAVLSVEVAVLVVTGVALFFVYRPSMSQAWSDLLPESTDSGVRVAHALRRIHLVASRLAMPTGLATGILVGLSARRAGRVWPGAATGAGIAVVTFSAAFTGLLLPWDQLALWAVTVGTNLGGYEVLFGDTVRFVLIGGVQVSRGTIVRWLLVHMLLLGPALVGLVALAWRRRSAFGQSRVE